MRLILHVLKKDIRRSWWAMAVTLALLAMWARLDGGRADVRVGTAEVGLNFLLPAAWTFLIALAIHEEPLVGDRQFWISRPYRWPALVASKALLLVLSIHAPVFVADCAILAARGFQPLSYFPHLLWKQVVLVAVLTLPAAALAALVRNLSHFMLAAIAVAGATVVWRGIAFPFPWGPIEAMRLVLTALVPVVAALAIVWVQCATRRTIVARCLGIAALLVAAALYAWLPPGSVAALRFARSAAHPELSLHLASERRPPAQAGWAAVALPVAFSGVPASAHISFDQIDMEIVGPRGDHCRAAPGFGLSQFRTYGLRAALGKIGKEDWELIMLDRPSYDHLMRESVRVRGTVLVTFRRIGETTLIPVGGAGKVPDLGRCSSAVDADRPPRAILEVDCESPVEIPPVTHVMSQVLNSAESMWLSPLHRGHTAFIVDANPAAPKGLFAEPIEILRKSKIAITTEPITGYALLHFELSNIRLSDYAVAK